MKLVSAGLAVVLVVVLAALVVTAGNLSEARSDKRAASTALANERAALKRSEADHDATQDELYESQRFGSASQEILGVVVEALEMCERVSGVEVESLIICDKLTEIGPIAEEYNGGTDQ